MKCCFKIISLYHFIGFYHEHSRGDRNTYIEVDMEAINKYESENFWPKNFFGRNYQICNARDCRAHNIYDHDSIMHYGPYLEGTNLTVIKSKQVCNGKPCTFGQRKRLSLIDIKDIISLYGCGKISSTSNRV